MALSNKIISFEIDPSKYTSFYDFVENHIVKGNFTDIYCWWKSTPSWTDTPFAGDSFHLISFPHKEKESGDTYEPRSVFLAVNADVSNAEANGSIKLGRISAGSDTAITWTPIV